MRDDFGFFYSESGKVTGHGSWTIFGIEPQGQATVDNNPDRRRLRPANRSKVRAETSSLQVMQLFGMHSGAGPLPGAAAASGSSSSDSVSFEDPVNRFLRFTGKSYQLFESVSTESVAFEPVPLRASLLSPPNKGPVDPTTHEPKQFFAVFQDVSAQILAQSWVNPRPR